MTTETDSTSQKSLAQLIVRVTAGQRSVGEMVYDVLREAIETGTFAPGEWLRQELLAEMIGVSRIPVRSALIQLESEGLVVFHPRRGAQVQSVTVDQVREAYELRALVEPYALRKSMNTMTRARLTQLAKIADRLDAMPAGPDLVRLRQEFYRNLYHSPHKSALTKLIEDLRTSIGLYLLGKRIAHPGGHSHRHLVDVVASGDADAAVAVLLEHIGAVRDGVEQIITGESVE